MKSNPMKGFGLLGSLGSLKPVFKVEEFGGCSAVVVIVVRSLNEQYFLKYFLQMEVDRTLVISSYVFTVVAVGGTLTSQCFTAFSFKPLGTLLGNENHFNHNHAPAATN